MLSPCCYFEFKVLAEVMIIDGSGLGLPTLLYPRNASDLIARITSDSFRVRSGPVPSHFRNVGHLARRGFTQLLTHPPHPPLPGA